MARLQTTEGETGATILVVDDQEDPRESMRTLLERAGHRVVTAATGAAALELLTREQVQLVLVDYVMPGMNGAELVQRIRAFDPYVQIVLQTGYAGGTPPLTLLAELDIQGYHNKTDGPDALLMWVAVGLKAHRLIQRLLERERTQAEFVGSVSHELRTPLNIIGGYVEMLLDQSVCVMPAEALAPLRAIAATNRGLGELIDKFLQYARADAGVLTVERDTVEIAALAAEMSLLGRAVVVAPGVTFTVDVDQAPASLVTDAINLRTILRNLIGNAAKFTTAGAIRLEIAAKGATSVFRVHDTGPGIPTDQLEVIFEPFRQVAGSSARKLGGVGLGLALSRKLAEALGGRLEASSRPGVGSVFSLTIPSTPPNEASAGNPPSSGRSAGGRTGQSPESPTRPSRRRRSASP